MGPEYTGCRGKSAQGRLPRNRGGWVWRGTESGGVLSTRGAEQGKHTLGRLPSGARSQNRGGPRTGSGVEHVPGALKPSRQGRATLSSAQRTETGGSLVTPPRPWGSPRPGARSLTSVARPAPPPASANRASLRAPRDARARPHPPISACQAALAAPMAVTPVRQVPSRPPPSVSPAPSGFTPCHRSASDNEDAAPSPSAATPASYPRARVFSHQARPGGSAHLPVLCSAPPE